MDNTIATSMPTEIQTNVASALLKLGAIKFEIDAPFTWVSGIKSPVYCDNRMINSDVKVRNLVIDAFVSEINRLHPGTEVIAGVATGGISFGALIADRMNVPFVYVRQAPKEHGLKKQVEGHIEAGQKVVLIEDHISTGGSSLKAVQGIRMENVDFQGLVSVMTYNFPIAAERFAESNVPFTSLSDLDIAVAVARENGYLTSEQADSVLAFRDSPKDWWQG